MKPVQILKTKEVDQTLLKSFENYLPKRFDKVINREHYTEEEFILADKLDRVDFHYRMYLKTSYKTLHRVFLDFKSLGKDNFQKGLDIIDEIAKILERNEFYELLVRHTKAREKILKLNK
jgi:hypothetical protein